MIGYNLHTDQNGVKIVEECLRGGLQVLCVEVDFQLHSRKMMVLILVCFVLRCKGTASNC